MRRRVLTAAVVAVMAFVAAGCGGSKNAAEPLPPTPTLTVPGESGTPSVPKTADTTTDTSTSTSTSTTPTPAATTPSNPSTPQGGAAPPQTGGVSPDSPSNNTSPPAGSPAQRFEQFCKDNPGAC
ncbi:MAG: hypothetical protein ACJ76Z_16190 [Thermoleophilaceae bacterium]